MYLNDFYSKVYIIHYKPLKERKEYLSAKLEEFGLTEKTEWVEQFETDDSLKDISNPFNIPKKLLAVNSSHIYCYKQQLINKYNNILILEDDIDLESTNLNIYLDQAAFEFEKLDGDMAFLSTCCGLAVKNPKPPTLLYYNPNYITRCTGAYIVNLRCTEKLIAACSTNFHAIDRVLNYMIPHMGLRILWSGLPLKQGSETGKYRSNMLDIRDKNGNYKQ
jgi:GR25 family glycosyltransferase involved in LPS biosynthesis